MSMRTKLSNTSTDTRLITETVSVNDDSECRCDFFDDQLTWFVLENGHKNDIVTVDR